MALARNAFATHVSQQKIVNGTRAQAGDALATMLGQQSVANGLTLTDGQSIPDIDFEVSLLYATYT
jgi:hypothetical protein